MDEERDLLGASRSAQVLHITPKLAGESARLVLAALAKLEGTAAEQVQLVVIVADRQTAYQLATLSRTQPGATALVPLTVSPRAQRLLQRAPRAVAGTATDLLALVRSSALKLGGVAHAVLLAPEPMLVDERHNHELETLLGEMPRTADRTLIVDRVSAPLEAFLERSGMKPRRITHDLASISTSQTVHYVIVAAEQRATVLQRLVDTHDLGDLSVVAHDPAATMEAGEALLALGLELPQDARVLDPGVEPTGTLVVWYGIPRTVEALNSLARSVTSHGSVVLLATAAELQRLRAVAANLELTPYVFPQRTDEVAQRQRAMREELATLLRRESLDSELTTIEPLLAEHDAAEIAAAALRLLGRARLRSEQAAQSAAAASSAAAPSRQTAPAPPDQPWTRLFLSVGERDGARRSDLVGAIAGEADIAGSQIGKIDMHDTYSLVDVATPVAERVIERMSGASIRGRKVAVRLDRGKGAPEPRRPGSGRPSAPDRSDGGARGPRAAREQHEWSDRAERLRHARRPPGTSDDT